MKWIKLKYQIKFLILIIQIYLINIINNKKNKTEDIITKKCSSLNSGNSNLISIYSTEEKTKSNK